MHGQYCTECDFILLNKQWLIASMSFPHGLCVLIVALVSPAVRFYSETSAIQCLQPHANIFSEQISYNSVVCNIKRAQPGLSVLMYAQDDVITVEVST